MYIAEGLHKIILRNITIHELAKQEGSTAYNHHNN
jgi:hypothetical protein